MTNNTENGINCWNKISLLIVLVSAILLIIGIWAAFKTQKFTKKRDDNKGWFLR